MKNVCSLEPQNIDEFNWYYESKNFITVVHEVRNADGSYQRTDQFKIPKRMLIQSLKRMN